MGTRPWLTSVYHRNDDCCFPTTFPDRVGGHDARLVLKSSPADGGARCGLSFGSAVDFVITTMRFPPARG